MSNSRFSGFESSLFRFLGQLNRNNNRPWFQEHKARYESDVLNPSLAFIRAFQPHLKTISPYFEAIAKRSGGSLMRVYRDTRFAKDKQPYKTNVGMQFRHELGKDVHAPGFYVHIEPKQCFLGVGLWHPESSALSQIRQAIDSESSKWKRARDNKRFRSDFDLAGDSLKSNPRGYERDHPMIEDLKRKDFVAVFQLSDKQVVDTDFLEYVSAAFLASRPFMRFLCTAMTIPF